ncbi:MAG: ATP-binding protein, partial [Candidatus Aminicenantia bacterium]
LWSKTPLAKFNWHSALEIINPEGEILSRFSLNMPIFYFAEFSFPLRDEWSIIEQEMPFLGKEKKVLIGYKDWFEGETLLGRTILYLSIDYDMLPFIRSQNPYSEILRAPFLPSFGRTEFGIAVFNTNGSLLFNPEKLSTGISPDLLTLINNSSKPIWSSFTDRGKKHQSLYFKFENRIYSLFYPLKSIKKYFVEYWKLFLSYLILFSFIISIYLFITKKTIKNPIWSFSNKVYLSFFIIAVLPLLLFSIFTKNFFTREFTEQFKEKAEAHLNFVHRVMEDFVSLQMEKEKGMKILPDDLVLWISSTISNDVNLYQNGRITSSSRRELFKIGLLPEIIAGETYYQILAENKPFDIRQEKIGTYSYYTLTVPALLFNKIFLLSLPFPYGQEEISEATQELIEFLVFASTFIIGLAFILARSMGSIILTPIKKLLSGTKQVSQGNLEVSINHKPKDEMKTLIDGFNTMVKNLKKQQEELSQISKKIAWAEMTKRVAHEIKNPLTPIQLSAEHILKVHQDKASNFDQALKESAEYIIKEVENLRKIAQKFLDFSREEALKKELFNLKEAFQEIIRPYKKLFSGKIKFIESYLTEELNIYGDKEKLKISFRNILINAIEAIRKKGEVEIKLKKGQNWVNIEIRDTGIGMEKDLLEKVFQPYFSTKDIGTGLGLPIAKKIIEEHGGQIKALSKLGEGTTVVIKLPIE